MPQCLNQTITVQDDIMSEPQVCNLCDYFAGQTTNMTKNEDRTLHQEIDHPKEKVYWVHFYERN